MHVIKIMADQEQNEMFSVFINLISNEISFLQGCLEIMLTEHNRTRFVTQDSLAVVNAHLAQLQAQLKDFEMRLKDYE